MKIAIISPNRQHLAELATQLKAEGHQVLTSEGGKTRMRAVADSELPDLIIVDGMCCDTHELSLVTQVTAAYPSLRVMLLCASHTPEFLLESMRAGVREVLPSPPPADVLSAAVRRLGAGLGDARAARGQVLAFIGAKGGSGATFLATSVAAQLAATRSVLLVDLNLQFGDALSFVADVRPQATLADVARDISRLDASLLASSTTKAGNLSVLAAPDDMAQSMDVAPEHVDAILDVAASQYDFIVLDLPRVMDAVTTRALDRAQRVHIVMQASLPHVRNAARLLQVFRSLGYAHDKAGIVLNRYDRSDEIAPQDIHRSLGGPAMVTLANSWREVNTAINHGSPLVAATRGAAARQVAAFAASMVSPVPQQAPPLMQRLFRKA